jgi:hypothetical protein
VCTVYQGDFTPSPDTNPPGDGFVELGQVATGADGSATASFGFRADPGRGTWLSATCNGVYSGHQGV